MPQGPMASPLMRPLVVLALPGMYLFYKYNQYKRRQQESARRRLTERELLYLHHKIDKLLSKLEENEPELATTQEEECVICINAKATMQTAPCGHQVVCRRCFVKTIQMAVSQRLLPLRCVVCRTKILRLKQTGTESSSSGHHHHHHHHHSSSSSGGLPASASAYSVTTAHSSSTSSMPNSDSLYSVSSGTSSISGTSSLSTGSNGGHCGKSNLKCCSTGTCFGGAYPRQPTGALRRSQQHAMKLRLQDYWHGEAGAPGRLPPIRELPPCAPSGPQAPSTRIRCAQKIVTQLETTAPSSHHHNSHEKKDKKPVTKPSSIIKSLSDLAPGTSKEVPYKPLVQAKADASPGRTSNLATTDTSPPPSSSHLAAPGTNNTSGLSLALGLAPKLKKRSTSHENKDNKKNELAEKKREEKAKQKAEKEAKREAKKEAKKEEEQAKKEAKEEKKKAKKEAKAAAAAAAQAAAVVIVATSVEKKI